MKFSDYKKQNNKTAERSAKENAKIDKSAQKLLDNIVKNYEGKPTQDIVDEIVKVAERQRREGTLSDSDLDNFASMLMPFIDQNQKKQLEQIISRLKKI